MAVVLSKCAGIAASVAVLSCVVVSCSEGDSGDAADARVDQVAHVVGDALPSAEQRADAVRCISIDLAVDREFRQSSGWREQLDADLAWVSSQFRRQFRLSFVTRNVVEWDSGPWADSIQELLGRAEAELNDEPVDVVVAVSGREITAPGGEWNADMGAAQYFGRFMVLRFPPASTGRKYLREAMLHEFGHLFGAWHTRSVDAVMRVHPAGDPAEAYGLDSAETIERFRLRSFPYDVTSMSESDASWVTLRFRANHVPGEMHPIAEALQADAIEAYRIGNEQRGLELFLRAIAYSTSAEGGDGPNTTLLRRLAEHRERGGLKSVVK